MSEKPYRKNCEGYFVQGNKILAKEINGILVFPGGGFNEDFYEFPESAIKRECFEETGAIIKNLKKVKTIFFDWDEDWITSEKQKQRFEKYKGEEMHIFSGEIAFFEEISEEELKEDFWGGEKLMEIEKAIEILESQMPFKDNLKEYRETQLSVLRLLR